MSLPFAPLLINIKRQNPDIKLMVQHYVLISAVRRLPKQLISFNNMLGHYLIMPWRKAGEQQWKSKEYYLTS
jgi:hypothetical protein